MHHIGFALLGFLILAMPAQAGRPYTCESTCEHGVTTVYTPGGKHTCNVQFRFPCEPFGCDTEGRTCAASCNSDADCAPGAGCDAASMQCATVPQAQACASSCTDAHAVVYRSDATQGTCVQDHVYPCFPYRCDGAGEACGTTCVTHLECADGAQCNAATGACVPIGYLCYGAFAAQSTAGILESCSPYTCVAGVCREHCDAVSDCATGYSCVNRNCVGP